MMKRKAAAALALLMTVSMLAGCGSDGGDIDILVPPE